MHQDRGSDGVISEHDLAHATELFRHFEGATDPLSSRCKESEQEFNAYVENLYEEKVKPVYSSLTFSEFRSRVRNVCRVRLSKEGPPYPCP
jgi:hypothetical protein